MEFVSFEDHGGEGGDHLVLKLRSTWGIHGIVQNEYVSSGVNG